jgi:cytochrome o ubiquinol oxidase subunit 2
MRDRATGRGSRRIGARRPGRLAAAGVLAVAASVALGGCARLDVLDPAGPVGAGERQILLDALAVMLAIVIPVIVATLGFAWWFRASNERAVHRPDWEFSGRIELVVWSIPALVVVFLGGMAWVSSHDLDPSVAVPGPAPPVRVQVVSLDWKWLFLYPDLGVASVNRLVLPAGTPVSFQLTSGSVMTAFFVPRLGSMIYTMNGMVTPLHLQADRPGIYAGEASHFSGDGFADMRFNADALTPADFTAWAARARAAGPVLDDPAYEALARQSAKVAPFTYRAYAPGLFDDIVMRRLPPGPGPAPTPSPSTTGGSE